MGVFSSGAKALETLIHITFQLKNAIKCVNTGFGSFDDSGEKKLEPLGKIMMGPNPHQIVIIQVSMSLKKIGQV